MNRGLKISAFSAVSIFFLSLTMFAQRDRVVEKPTPTPVPAVSPSPTPAPVQTLGSLRAKILGILRSPELRRGHVGIKIVNANDGKVVFEENSEKLFMPASNMKVFTVAAAIQKLSPNFKFRTSVFAETAPQADGTLTGNLTIFGRGDMTFSQPFDEGTSVSAIERLAEKIAAAGIKRIEGDLIGDESYFLGYPLPQSWEWDDLQWGYGAGISALGFNDNTILLKVLPGSPGAPCVVRTLPETPSIKIVNTCKTNGSTRELRVTKLLDQDAIEIDGVLPSNNEGFSGTIAVSKPGEIFLSELRKKLEAKGITVSGRTYITEERKPAPENRLELAYLESTPLSIIAQKTMKPSQNLYTETLLWTLGEEFGDKTDQTKTSSEKGLAVVQQFLQEAGVSSDSIIQWDGSGLSRHNLVTPDAVVRVYKYMATSPYAIAWNSALTIGGVDGTLKNRFKQTTAANNVRGKTGTIDQVSSLSGFVKTAAGEDLIFSIIVNGVPQTRDRVKAIDAIVVALADFNGSTVE